MFNIQSYSLALYESGMLVVFDVHVKFGTKFHTCRLVSLAPSITPGTRQLLNNNFIR